MVEKLAQVLAYHVAVVNVAETGRQAGALWNASPQKEPVKADF